MRRLTAVAASLGLLGALAAGGAQAKTIGGIVPDVPNAHAAAHEPRAHIANLPYGGGPVLHSNRAHVIFWQPSGSGLTFDPGYQALIQQFLMRVAADSHKPGNVYGLTGQYADAQGPAAYASTYGGSTVDTDRLPRNGCVEPPLTGPGWTVCMTDRQLQTEIENVVRADHLPTGSARRATSWSRRRASGAAPTRARRAARSAAASAATAGITRSPRTATSCTR